jgi:hypothetical protein
MEPGFIGPQQWDQVGRAILLLFLFAAFGLNAALSLLLGHAVIPSLVSTEDAPRTVGTLRWALYPVFVLSLALALYCVVRALIVTVSFLGAYYPRFWI